MTAKMDKTISRRTFVKGGGSLVVGFSLAGAVTGEALEGRARERGYAEVVAGASA